MKNLVLLFVVTLVCVNQSQAADLLVVPFQFKNEGLALYTKTFGRQAHQILTTDWEQMPEYSTGDIVKSLRESVEPLRLVCFHKAAADCLSALLLYPKLSKQVSEFVSLEGKLKGAEYAEKAMSPFQPIAISRAQKLPIWGAIKSLINAIRYFTWGYHPGFYSMSPQARQQYMQSHQHQIKNLSREMKLLYLDSSSKKYGHLPYSEPLETSQYETD